MQYMPPVLQFPHLHMHCQIVDGFSTLLRIFRCLLDASHWSVHQCFQLPLSNLNNVHGMVLLYCRMLDVVASDADLFGAERAQQAKQQQGWLAELKGGLLSGNLFRRFLQQHCSRGSQTSQICGHQAFAQAVSASLR